eukprot:GFUD01045581.1.p1 GENE.GFUD01045581.1~~GFUD01045581.1.p1  ORF type:complete len:350 (-),score=103.36 GFUD01045581.1:75-1124(-)
MEVQLCPKRANIKLNIGKINKKISGLEVQKNHICGNILQLKQARDKLILTLRTVPQSDQIATEPSIHFTEFEFPPSDSVLSNDIPSDDPIVISDDEEESTSAPEMSKLAICEDQIIVDDISTKSDSQSHQIVSVSSSNGRSTLWNNNYLSDVKKDQILSEFKFKVPEKSPVLKAMDVLEKKGEPPHTFKVPANPFSLSESPTPVPRKERPVQFKPPPPVQKSKKAKHFEAQHILGKHRSNKPVNSVASFNKAKYRMLRPSGRRGAVVRGRLIEEVKFVTRDPITYSGTGFRNKGVVGHGVFVVTGQHDEVRQAVQPVHLDGQAQLTREGRVVFNGEVYSQCSQTQGYAN